MEYDTYLKRKNIFKENKYKACTNLYKHCVKVLKSKIEARSDFESLIYNKPINLLQSIIERSLSYEEDRCKMATIIDAFKDYFQCMQLNGKSLLDYTR